MLKTRRFYGTLTALLTVVLVAVTGCGGSSGNKPSLPGADSAQLGAGTSSGGSSSAGGDAIKIGWIGPLEGVLATYGIENKRGVEFARDEINAAGGVNGKQVEVIFVNTKFDSNLAVQSVRRLALEDKVVAVIGDVASAVSVATVEETRKLKVPQVASLAGTPKITQMGSNYIFRPYPSVINTFTAAAEYAVKKLGYKKFAFLAYNDEGGIASMQAFITALAAVKGEIVGTEVVPVDAKDFRSTLAKLKASNPDALAIAAAAPVSGLIAKQAREMGWEVPLLGHGGYQAQMEFRNVSGKAGDGMVLATSYAPGSYTNKEAQDFVTKFKAKFNKEPGEMEAYGYDQLKMIVDAIKKAGGPDREKVRDALAEMKNWPGAAGPTTFLPNGDVQKPLIMQKWVDGKLTPIEVYGN